MVSNKIIFIFFVLCFGCTRVGENTYGLWFDPRGKEFKQEQIKKEEEKVRRQEDEEWKLRYRRIEAAKNKEKQQEAEEKDRENLNRKRKAWLDELIQKNKREAEALQAKAASDELQKKKEEEVLQCEIYRENNCKEIRTQKCSSFVIKECKVVSGKTICWNSDKKECAPYIITKCNNEPLPTNCVIY